MRRLVAVLGIAVMVAAGCSDDDDGGGGGSTSTAEDAEATTTTAAEEGDAEAFCDALEPVQDIDPDVLPTEEDVDNLEAAADEAPDEDLSEATGVIADLASQLVGLDVDDSDALQEAQEAALDEEVVDAANELSTFSEEECGSEVPIFTSLAGTATTGGDGSEDEGPAVDIDTDALRTALEENAPDVEEQITSIVSVNDQFSIGVDSLSDADAAVDICDTVGEQLVELGGEGATVEVGDTEGTILATGEAGTDCEAA